MATGQWRPTRVNVAAELRAGALQGTKEGTEHLLGVSRELAPIEEGILAGSGTASQAVNGSLVEGAVSFDTPYAVIQHEALEFRHDAGKQAKYLEQPFATERTVIGQMLATAMRRRLGG